MDNQTLERAMRLAGMRGEPQDSQPVDCTCGWQGTIGECDMSYRSVGDFRRLSGRTGYQWYCPQCNEVVWSYWILMS